MRTPRKRDDSEFLSWVIMALVLFFSVWMAALVHAAKPKPYSPGVRVLRLSNRQVGNIRLAPGRATVLSFPARPSKVIVGDPKFVSVEYVENDLSFSVLRPFIRSNAFVYVEGRRFAFHLIFSAMAPDAVLFIREEKD